VNCRYSADGSLQRADDAMVTATEVRPTPKSGRISSEVVSMTRAITTLVGAAVAGGLIWVAAQVSQETTGGYWAQIGILAGAGLALALARLPDVGIRTLTPSLPTLGLAFLPSLVAAGWVVVATQPHGNTFRRHALSWSSDIHVIRVVRDLGPYAIVLAFGLGVVLGLVFERRAIEPLVTKPVATEPVAELPRTLEPAPTVAPVEDETEVRDPELARRGV
jgi:hypothetical protein